MAFPIDKAALVSLLVEAILYGLYILLFCCTIYVLVYKRSSPQIHIGMLIATILLFVLATAHLITNFLRLLDAFHTAQFRLGAAAFEFEDQATFKNLFKTSVLVAEIIIGDVVLIYRCYVAWGGSIRIIVAPLIILLGTIVTSSGVVYSFAKAPPHSEMFKLRQAQQFIAATQVLVLVNNVVCTSLLTWKLWRMSRTLVSRTQRETLRSVALIISESGLITAMTWIIFVIVYATRCSAEVIVLDALAPITGCAFCLIVSRVALGLDNDTDLPSNSMIHHRGDEEDTSPVRPVLDGTGRPHRPVEINVSSRQSVRVETEMDIMYKEKKTFTGLAIL